jgi:hypothetical protein
MSASCVSSIFHPSRKAHFYPPIMANLLPSSLGTTIRRTASIDRGIRARSGSDAGGPEFSDPWSENTIPIDPVKNLEAEVDAIRAGKTFGGPSQTSDHGHKSERSALTVRTTWPLASTTSAAPPTPVTPSVLITDISGTVKVSVAQKTPTTEQSSLEKAATEKPGWEDEAPKY